MLILNYEKVLTVNNPMNLKFTNLAVIAILFGNALIESVQKQNWLEVTLFLSLVAIALWADFRKTN